MVGFPVEVLTGQAVGTDLSLGFAVQVLIAAAPPDGGHGAHPEVIGIGAHGVNGLLEARLDLEAPAVETDHVQRVHGQVGGHEDQPTP